MGRVTLRELGLSPEKSVGYEATPVNFFHSVLAKLAIDYPRTVFIDFGSGKGRTLLLASHYPFRSIVGVEMSPALCQIALENIKKYAAYHQPASQISVVCRGIDELEYDRSAISDHVLVYIFNPCSGSVLAAALHKLSRLVAEGVSITIVYLNPVWLKVLSNASWLKQVRYGETFDETGNSFMPYVVFQGLPQQWREAIEILAFQFGPWVFARWAFSSFSNSSSPLVAAPLGRPPVLRPVTQQQMRDDGTICRRLSFDGHAIRYVPYHGKRYFIDLSGGSFSAYLTKFSGKTRNTLKRKLRRFVEHSGGQIDFRCYSAPGEMIEFRQHAIAVSVLTYQRRIGWGFPEDEEYRNVLIEEAEEGRVRGFLLMHDARPVAYAFCRIDSEIMTYARLGHDPKYEKFSPGTVLLTLIIERLFAERRCRIFDFGGMASDYKAFFATGSVDYVKVIWLPITAKHLGIVLTHYAVLQAWRGAAWLKQASRNAFVARCLALSPLGARQTSRSEINHALAVGSQSPERARPDAVRQ